MLSDRPQAMSWKMHEAIAPCLCTDSHVRLCCTMANVLHHCATVLRHGATVLHQSNTDYSCCFMEPPQPSGTAEVSLAAELTFFNLRWLG